MCVFQIKNRRLRIGGVAYCQNITGKKENIQIGNYCDIDARICANGPNAQISIGDYTTSRYGSVVRAVEKLR